MGLHAAPADALGLRAAGSVAGVDSRRRRDAQSLALRLLERLELRMYRDATAIVCLTEGFIRTLPARGIEAREAALRSPTASNRRSGRRRTARPRAPSSVSGRRRPGQLRRDDWNGARPVARCSRPRPCSARRRPTSRFSSSATAQSSPRCATAAARHGLTNVTFTGLVPREKVPGILAATDIALVTLKPSDVFKTVLPSKMFEAMAARVRNRARRRRRSAGDARAGRRRHRRATWRRAALAAAIARPGRRPAIVALGWAQAGGEFVAREFSRRALGRTLPRPCSPASRDAMAPACRPPVRSRGVDAHAAS